MIMFLGVFLSEIVYNNGVIRAWCVQLFLCAAAEPKDIIVKGVSNRDEPKETFAKHPCTSS